MAESLKNAALISTVSKTYAREILTPEYGERLDPLLRDRRDRLFGILNGIDYETMNPATDPNISANFDTSSLEQRRVIWQKIFPDATPLSGDFDVGRLARLNLAGGNIHSVAINAAFLAARAASPVTMPLVLSAARDEFRKLERPAKDSDFAWHGNPETAR